MEKIGLYGGCFNPPTKAHIQLAKQSIQEYQLSKVIIVPVGNQYKKENLIDAKYRYEMLKIATQYDINIEVSDIELKIQKPLNAIDIFKILKRKYPNKDLYYILGADNLANITKWKAAEELVSNYQFILLERQDITLDKLFEQVPLLKKHKQNFYPITLKIQHSSTYVREHIQQKEWIKDMVDAQVIQYIKENKLYI